jgi:broad specificity phosphatase PhoE
VRLELILVRHGETEWNVGEIFRGRIDIDLNETGEKQAELLSEYLSGLKIEAVYSSPLKRALNTAQAIARHHHVEVQIRDGLNDLDFGQWQGLSLREVSEKYKELYAEWANHPERVRLPGGQTLGQVKERAIKVVDEVTAKYEGAAVLVSHRVVNKVLICALLGLDDSHFWNIRLDTCGLTTFSYENGRFVLTRHNDTSFLKPLKGAKLADF